MNEPAKLYIGMDATWTESVPEYPATDGWTLKYSLTNASYQVSLSSTAEGSDHVISIAAADTSTWHAGNYYYTKYAESATEKFVIAQGQIQIIASVLAATDRRSHAQKMLDAIEATLESRATKEQLSLSIANRSIQYLTIEELTKARSYYKELVKAETNQDKINAGEQTGNKILVRFV